MEDLGGRREPNPRSHERADTNDHSLAQTYTNLLSAGSGVYVGLWCKNGDSQLSEFRLVDAKSFSIIGLMFPFIHYQRHYSDLNMSFSLSSGRMALELRSTRTLMMWDIGDEQKLFTHEEPMYFTSRTCYLCMNNSGTKIAISTLGRGEGIDILDTESKTRIRLPLHLRHGIIADTLIFSHDDEYVLAYSQHHLHCWSLQTGVEILCTPVDKWGAMPTLITSPGSTYCALLGYPLVVWNYESGKCCQLKASTGGNSIKAACFGNGISCSNLFVMNFLNRIRRWDVETKELKFEVSTIELDKIIYCPADDSIFGCCVKEACSQQSRIELILASSLKLILRQQLAWKDTCISCMRRRQ